MEFSSVRLGKKVFSTSPFSNSTMYWTESTGPRSWLRLGVSHVKLTPAVPVTMCCRPVGCAGTEQTPHTHKVMNDMVFLYTHTHTHTHTSFACCIPGRLFISLVNEEQVGVFISKSRVEVVGCKGFEISKVKTGPSCVLKGE